MVKVEVENGYYIFKLRDVLKNKHITINQIMRDTNTDFKVIKRIMEGNLVRVDILVLARLCDYLGCLITDLIEYVPNTEEHVLANQRYKF